jgi:hypothetical protein
MPLYNINLNFQIEIKAEIEEEITEEQMVEMLEKLYQTDPKECKEAIEFSLLEEKVDYKIQISKHNPQ